MIIPIMRGSSPRRRDDNIPSIPRQLASRRRTYGAKVVRVGVRLRVAPVHARRRGRGRLECWSFLPQIALPPSPLCLRPRAAVALMSRLALEINRLAQTVIGVSLGAMSSKDGSAHVRVRRCLDSVLRNIPGQLVRLLLQELRLHACSRQGLIIRGPCAAGCLHLPECRSARSCKIGQLGRCAVFCCAQTKRE